MELTDVSTLSARHLAVRVDRDQDGVPVLAMDDGESEIRIEAAIGDRDHAADRLVRLAATALAVATELRVTCHAERLGGEVRWWEHTS